MNIEENSSKQPFGYTLPKGILREQSLGVFNTLQNEQSLSLRIDRLCDGDSKAVFKYTESDMRVYERLQMFIHAEERREMRVPDDALSVFIRLGSDFTNNYYEYEIPLKISRLEDIEGLQDVNSTPYKEAVWKAANQFDFPLAILRELKTERNGVSFDNQEEFVRIYNPDGGSTAHRIKVKGNPNLGFVKVMMIGVRNPKKDEDYLAEYDVEVWINELRLTGLDERGGYAGIARMDMNLADLGSVSVGGNFSTIGFGALDNGVQERSRESVKGYDLATNLELGKFFPDDWGVRVPFYAQRSNTTTTPEYDPYDLDIRLQDKLDAIDEAAVRDSVRRQAQEIVNLVTYNFTNVGKERTAAGGDDKPKPWDIENFTASYGYTRQESSDPLVEQDVLEEYQGGFDYTFSRPTKYLEPFKGLKAKPLRIIKEINLNPLPNNFSFTNTLDRRFRQTRYRFSGVQEQFNTFFNKNFLWNRNYDLIWDITRSLKFNFNANANAVIDEPDETAMLEDPNILDRAQFRRDSIWNNIRDLGRPKLYQHALNVSYTLPLRYLPYMDWVQMRAQYQGGYSWNAASLNVDSLGNVIQNNQTRQISADLSFDKLYDSVPFLKKINRPARPSRGGTPASGGRGQQPQDREGKDNARASKNDVDPTVRALVRPLLLVRKGRFSYSEQFSTTVPGFTPSPQLLGMASGFSAPGWGFAAGLQPTIRTLSDTDRAAANTGTPSQDDWLYNNRNWITGSVFQNREVIQNYTISYDGRLTLEPLNDFRIEVEGNYSFTENYTETFKVVDKENNGGFEHRLPVYGGQLTVSYNALKTMFNGGSTEDAIALFNTFQSYRPVVSQRLGGGLHFEPDLAAEGYTEGYGRNQQEVLIPAFIAAYTGQDPNAVDLDPFNTGWKPNWRVTYNGLSKVKAFQKIFTNFSLTHSYKSTFTIGNYATSLLYSVALRDNPNGAGLDPDTYNYLPRIEIPDVQIQEAFAPLLAMDMQFQNGMTFNIDYKQSRNVGLNVTSKLVSENRTKEIAAGFGYVMKGVNIGFLTGRRTAKPVLPMTMNLPRHRQAIDPIKGATVAVLESRIWICSSTSATEMILPLRKSSTKKLQSLRGVLRLSAYPRRRSTSSIRIFRCGCF
ncbi:MAG: cell surface protein SprA [Saprospiraceae bacterium]